MVEGNVLRGRIYQQMNKVRYKTRLTVHAPMRPDFTQSCGRIECTDKNQFKVSGVNSRTNTSVPECNVVEMEGIDR